MIDIRDYIRRYWLRSIALMDIMVEIHPKKDGHGCIAVFDDK